VIEHNFSQEAPLKGVHDACQSEETGEAIRTNLAAVNGGDN
jgi:hypothetical protein